jgi:hypothetical protein
MSVFGYFSKPKGIREHVSLRNTALNNIIRPPFTGFELFKGGAAIAVE